MTFEEYVRLRGPASVRLAPWTRRSRVPTTQAILTAMNGYHEVAPFNEPDSWSGGPLG